jgi:hypothetical protein
MLALTVTLVDAVAAADSEGALGVRDADGGAAVFVGATDSEAVGEGGGLSLGSPVGVSEGASVGSSVGASDGEGALTVRLGERVGVGRVTDRDGSRLAVREPEPEGRSTEPSSLQPVRSTVATSTIASPVAKPRPDLLRPITAISSRCPS